MIISRRMSASWVYSGVGFMWSTRFTGRRYLGRPDSLDVRYVHPVQHDLDVLPVYLVQLRCAAGGCDVMQITIPGGRIAEKGLRS